MPDRVSIDAQNTLLREVRDVMRSYGTGEPKGMTLGTARLGHGFAGQWWPQRGSWPMKIPSRLRIAPFMSERPTYQQIGVDVHELGHADHNPTWRGPGAEPRSVIEPRGVAYEQLFAPMVMRAMGYSVPDVFWTSDQAKHGYLKEFGQAAIDKQKAYLRSLYGAALYDREDVNARNRRMDSIRVPRRVEEDELMGPLKQMPHRAAPTHVEMMSKVAPIRVPVKTQRTYNGLH